MRSFTNARIKYLIPVLIFSFFFTTCKKDDDDNQLDAYFSDRLEIQPIRLFTANGEILDQEAIFDFVIRHTSSHNFQTFITNLDTIIDVADIIKIEYLSSSTAMFTYFDEITNRNVVEKDNLIYFEASDTTTLYHPIGIDISLADFFENLST